jgi:hypothetical protein
MDATKEQRRCNLLARVITGDERCIYGYDTEKRQHPFQWESPNLPRTERKKKKKPCLMKSKVKGILVTFFDIKGIDRKEFVLAGQAVNSAYCCDA